MHQWGGRWEHRAVVPWYPYTYIHSYIHAGVNQRKAPAARLYTVAYQSCIATGAQAIGRGFSSKGVLSQPCMLRQRGNPAKVLERKVELEAKSRKRKRGPSPVPMYKFGKPNVELLEEWDASARVLQEQPTAPPLSLALRL